MKSLQILIFIAFVACHTKENFSVIGSWKIETESSFDDSAKNFKVFYDRHKIDSLAARVAEENINYYKSDTGDISLQIKEMARLVVGSLHEGDSVLFTFNQDSTFYTENFDFKIGNKYVQRWIPSKNGQIRFYDLNDKKDTGVVYFINFLSANQMVMRQTDPNSKHAVCEFRLIRN